MNRTPENPEADPAAETVDKTLVAWFLSLTPEERVAANDRAIRAIAELRDAFAQAGSGRPGEPD